jgi:rSAM/selenodomain-associated transferase 2
MISVIVPARNEEQLLGRCLQSVLDQDAATEIIVVDGGSSDRTVAIAQGYPVQVITGSPPGLPRQLNAGAAAAVGDLFLFLHADTELVPGCMEKLQRMPDTVVGGAFTMQVTGNRRFYKILSLGGDVYCRLTRTYFGDRGMFVRRETFSRLGGFREMPIMTDVEFSRRMKRLGRTVLLPGPIRSSSRKFTDESPWRTLYLIFYALTAYRLGVDPETIRRKYYRK